MKKILVLPFLKQTSGHHQVADALMARFKLVAPELTCEKIDLLHYGYGKIEAFISAFYLKWIQLSPQSYHWIYTQQVCNYNKLNKRFYVYELLFKAQLLQLIQKKQPDLILCTHALPSYIANRLKQTGELAVPIVNVYTDFFIHTLWGLTHIDYHLVPDRISKQWLISKGVDEQRIIVSGIPIHPLITRTSLKPMCRPAEKPLTILITGGSQGTGALKSFVSHCLSQNLPIRFLVLCGENKSLHQFLSTLNFPNLTPLSYIQSREEMNQLYNEIDAVITKPGGVTISECIAKLKPIFIYNHLPGQEALNLQHLLQLGLVLPLDWGLRRRSSGNWRSGNPLDILQSPEQINKLHSSMTAYAQSTIQDDLNQVLLSIIRKT